MKSKNRGTSLLLIKSNTLKKLKVFVVGTSTVQIGKFKSVNMTNFTSVENCNPEKALRANKSNYIAKKTEKPLRFYLKTFPQPLSSSFKCKK